MAVLAQDAPGGQQLVAYVVAAALNLDASEAQRALREQLKAGLKEHLPDYMIPAHLLFLDQLPLTPNGKLDRKALPDVDTGLYKLVMSRRSVTWNSRSRRSGPKCSR